MPDDPNPAKARFDAYLRDLARYEKAALDRAAEMREFGQYFTPELPTPTVSKDPK